MKVLVSVLVVATCVGAVSPLAFANEHEELYTFAEDSPYDGFGKTVAIAGDVDRDGFDDILVGSQWDDGGGVDCGLVKVYSGWDGKRLYTYSGDGIYDCFGYALSGAGDVNADGYDDFIVGTNASMYGSSGSWHGGAGYARVFSGKDGKTLRTFSGSTKGDYFGYSVGGAGDVNADGYDDVIVGAYNSNYVKVFSGKDGKTLHSWSGALLFGHSVDGAGDVDGDGYDDLVVGIARAVSSGNGAVAVYSGKTGKVLYTFSGDSGGDHLGSSVSGAGDVNGDGYDDVIAGAPVQVVGNTGSGYARVYSGKDGKTLFTFDGDSEDDELGWSVTGAGDVNQDGYDDLLVGAQSDDDEGTNCGSARVYSGKDGEILQIFFGVSSGKRLGSTVSGGGDVNGDGIADLVVGANGYATVFASTGPTGSVTIDSGAAATNSTSVVLALSWKARPADIEEMRLRNAEDSWGDWIAPAASKSWTLSPGEGEKTVEVQFRDADGETSPVASDSILLDQTAPIGTVLIAFGAEVTSDPRVGLKLDYTDLQSGVTDVRLRNAGDAWGSWQAPAPSVPWNLTLGSGMKTVEAQFRDGAGNLSEIVSDEIEFKADVIGPTVSAVRLCEDRPYVCPEEPLRVEVYAYDNLGGAGLDAFRITLDGGKTWSDWQPFSLGSAANFPHPELAGPVTVRVVARDLVGNESLVSEVNTWVIGPDVPWLGAAGKGAGSIADPREADAFAVELVKGDLLTAKVKAKGAAKKTTLDLAVDLVRPDGERVILDRFPADAKKPGIFGLEVAETGRHLLVLRVAQGSGTDRGTYTLTAKVKAAKANRKGKGELTGPEILFDAAHGSTLKAGLKGEGLTLADVTIAGPDGPVTFEAKEGKGKLSLQSVVLDGGTGTYAIRFARALTVSFNWSLKLPKARGTVQE